MAEKKKEPAKYREGTKSHKIAEKFLKLKSKCESMTEVAEKLGCDVSLIYAVIKDYFVPLGYPKEELYYFAEMSKERVSFQRHRIVKQAPVVNTSETEEDDAQASETEVEENPTGFEAESTDANASEVEAEENTTGSEATEEDTQVSKNEAMEPKTDSETKEGVHASEGVEEVKKIVKTNPEVRMWKSKNNSSKYPNLPEDFTKIADSIDIAIKTVRKQVNMITTEVR